MPSAREIAEERFAKGEITEEEFDKLVSKLTATRERTESPQDSNVEQQKAVEEKPKNVESEGLSPIGKGASIVVGLYLTMCVFFFLGGAPKAAAEGIYKACPDRSHPFCRCQASNARAQHTFFKTPLIFLNIVPLKRPAIGCDHLNQ